MNPEVLTLDFQSPKLAGFSVHGQLQNYGGCTTDAEPDNQPTMEIGTCCVGYASAHSASVRQLVRSPIRLVRFISRGVPHIVR